MDIELDRFLDYANNGKLYTAFQQYFGNAAPPLLADRVQIAAEGLTPNSQYQGYLAESDHAPFGKLEPLAVLQANPAGAGIVQAIGPLKTLASAGGAAAGMPSPRSLIVTDMKDPITGEAAAVWRVERSVGAAPRLAAELKVSHRFIGDQQWKVLAEG